MHEGRVALFAPLFQSPLCEARQWALSIVYHVSLSLFDMGTALPAAFDGEEYDYVQRVNRLGDVKECEIWITNFLRHVADYLAKQFGGAQADPMEQALSLIPL